MTCRQRQVNVSAILLCALEHGAALSAPVEDEARIDTITHFPVMVDRIGSTRCEETFTAPFPHHA